jgi:hypothetical protein
MKRRVLLVLLFTSPIWAWDWEFNTDDNTEGWKGIRADVSVQDGILTATVVGDASGTYPWIEHQFGPYDANEIGGFYMKVKWSVPDASQFESTRFYWFPASGGHNSVAYAAPDDPNQFSVVYIDLLTREAMDNNNYWEGMINNFRIYLADGPAVARDYSVDFDWIRLEGQYIDNESFEYWDNENDNILGWNVPADADNFGFKEQATVRTREHALKIIGTGAYQRITQDIKGGLDLEKGTRINLTGALNIPTASWAEGSVIWFRIRELTHDGQENLGPPIAVTTWDDWFEFNSELTLIHEPADRAAVDIQLFSSTPVGTAFYADDIFVYVNFVDVPNVVGMTQTDAETAITAASLTVGTVATVNSNTVASGDVISQDPAAGTNITSGSAVDIVVSLGPVMLECEVEGYPCSLSEVPIEILKRSDALGDEVLAMFENGASTAEIKAWLNEQADMADVQSDDLAVRFRLNGGRGTWILREEAFATQSAPGAASSAPRPVLQSAVRLYSVVGEDIKPKNALVLSPMQWDLEGNKDGETVTAILASTRGYENVPHLTNETILETNVNIDSFKDWAGYQVIHVDSHGALICEGGAPCRAVILVMTYEAILEQLESDIITAEELATIIKEKGVVSVKVRRKDGKRSRELGLEADFFRKQYPGGLDNTLIFFNSCESYSSNDTDLANALRGSTSVFLGWDNAVGIRGSSAASKKLYQELSEWGYTVETAYNNLGNLKTDSRGARLILGKRKAGGDLRIRDVVYLLNPETMLPIPPYDSVAIVGEQGDGEPDAVPYLVQVDGVKKVNSDMLVYVQVDMSVELVQADPKPLSSGTVNDHDQWLVSGVVDLPVDVEEDELVTIKAWVYLPSGGESNHEVTVTLTGEEEESLLGEWVIDNDSLDVKATAFELNYVQGEIRATFRKDGKVDVVYDDWEYQVFDWDYGLEIGDITYDNYEEFTNTINAHGTTTYEIDGDRIVFGHSFESYYMEGTQTVHHIKDWIPDLTDVDRVFETSPTYRNVFTGSPNYELGSSLRLNGGKEFILHRVGSADE